MRWDNYHEIKDVKKIQYSAAIIYWRRFDLILAEIRNWEYFVLSWYFNLFDLFDWIHRNNFLSKLEARNITRIVDSSNLNRKSWDASINISFISCLRFVLGLSCKVYFVFVSAVWMQRRDLREGGLRSIWHRRSNDKVIYLF